MTLPLDILLTFLSAVPLAVLGAVLLALRPRRAEQVFLGAFTLLWSAQIAAANLGRVLDSASVHATSLLVSYALLPPAYLFLAHFATLQHPASARFRLLTPVAGLVAVAAAAVLLYDPRLVIASVTAEAGRLRGVTLGPAAVPLFNAPLFVVFYLALAGAYLRYREAPVGTPRHRARGLLLALALFTSYATFRYLLVFLDGATGVGVFVGASGGLALLFLAGALLVTALVAHLLLRPPAPEGRDLPLAAAFLVPALGAFIEGAVASGETFGLWRLATVAALVYALARHQLFDLDLRLKRLAGPAAAALCLGVGALLALLALAGGASAGLTAAPLLAGTVTAGALWASRARLGDLLFPEVSASPDYLYQRKLEVYRAHLERALGEGPERATEETLRRLRKSLGLSDREHQVMLYMVQSTGAAPAPGAAAEPEEAPRVTPGALILGRYRVERLLGEGAHGRAYLAHDERLDREVVVKVVGTGALGGRAARLLLREARLAGSLHHPNVVAVHDAAEGPYETVLVMEYADGGSLHNLLQRRGRLGLEEATAALEQILSGLEAAHGKGIVHRDIKPENILLLRDGTLKLADFGVAREARPDATGLAAGAAGTLLYMSPEQVRGLEVDARSDLYAAAVVFHQLLTGRYYLRIAGKDDFQVRQLILHGTPALHVRDQPAWVEPFLRRALAKDPEERFQSAAEMRAALREREALLAPSVPA